jgi:cyclic pyranopterin phosphate synthase
MPENPSFLPQAKLLSSDQLFAICSNLVDLGIDEIKLTGGEPLLRPDFLLIVQKISDLSIEKLSLTTNAIKLKKILPVLQQTKLKHINISIDSLDPKKFAYITKYDGLAEILDAVEMACNLGFQVKVNTVLLSGVNDNEIEDFISFSRKFNINIRFLEAMNIGEMVKTYQQYYLPVKTVINQIQQSHTMRKLQAPFDSTSFNYILENGAQIGFIASESKAFCAQCSRLRLGANGMLYPCLFVEHGINLKNIEVTEYPYLLEKLMHKKPVERVTLIDRPMYAIGG